MSSNFVVPPQRGFADSEQANAADLAAVQNQSSKMQVNMASLDAYSASRPMSSTSDPQASNGAQAAFVADQPPKPLPKIGETRCYWALLSSGLDFIYLDPVLQSHLETQASLLVGKSLLDFVHPDERASAEHDLGSVLESKTLHGSVTRVRYSRLSRVRHQLGHRIATSPWEEADKIALDSNYMAVDIVINWAADGLVLCFIHAVTDLTPNDNDEQHKSQWTNWCGTPWMSIQQIELLYQRLLVCIPQTTNPSRVFQILSNEDNKTLLMTWPPDQGQGRDYAKLVEAVNIRPTEQTGAKTSCTRRYKALQNMSMGEIESIIVPHGTIIFACHKVTAPRHSPTAGTSMQQMGYNANNFVSQQQNPQYYDQAGNTYPNTPPYPSGPPYNNSYPSQPPYPPQHWPEGADPLSSLAPPPNNMRSSSYPPQQQWPNQPYMDPSQAYPPRTSTPEYGYAPGAGNDSGSSSVASDVVPPPRRRVSPGIPGTTRETHGGRNSGNRPMGIQKCTSCKATQSPEWRKGPSGKKELCNACGLRYARSRAKKEGTALASHRKRKDKGLAVTTKRESATPSPINGSYSGSRRNGHDEISLSGSASGSEVHSHSGHAAMEVPSPLSSSNVHQSPHSNHNSQMSAMRMDSSYPRMPTSTSAPASYERERDEDRELPPTPVSPESRLSSARSILMLQQ